MCNFGLVSIITPTRNCVRFICDTIQSVQSQTYTNWELLIQDDCSNDDTKTIIDNYLNSDSRIKYECNSVPSGAAITRNNALLRAKGKWIAFLDADDIWLPDKLMHQLSFMIKNNYFFTYHQYTEMREDGSDMGILVSGKQKVSKFDMSMCCWPGCLTVVYDAEKVGIILAKNISVNNDIYMWRRVVKMTPCYLLKENLAKYRRRSGSVSSKRIAPRILQEYQMFHETEEMNCAKASFCVLLNIIGHSSKALFYKRKIR